MANLTRSIDVEICVQGRGLTHFPKQEGQSRDNPHGVFGAGLDINFSWLLLEVFMDSWSSVRDISRVLLQSLS